MKKIVFSIVLILFLSGCNGFSDFDLEYNEEDFVFEVNTDAPDFTSYFDIEYAFTIDDSLIDFTEVGTYTLNVTVEQKNNEKEFEVPVEIVDTTSPVITVPDTFNRFYEPGDIIDLSLITVLDNSGKDVLFSSNIHLIDMELEGTYSLVLTAIDESGNLQTTSVNITVRNSDVPTIQIITYNVSFGFFGVEFVENDIQNYKISSSYQIKQGEDIIKEGTLTDTFDVSVSNLIQNTTYTIKMEFLYQIPGGTTKTLTLTETVTTTALFLPMVDITDEEFSTDSISFRVTKIDPNNLVNNLNVKIYDALNVLLINRNISTDNLIEMTELNYGNIYTVVVSYNYDFKDGEGIIDVEETYYYQALALTEPYITIDDVYTDSKRLNVVSSAADPDNTITLFRIKVFQDGVSKGQMDIEIGEDVETTFFDQLRFGEDYDVEIVVEYCNVYGVTFSETLYSGEISIPQLIVNTFDAPETADENTSIDITVVVNNEYDHPIMGFVINGETITTWTKNSSDEYVLSYYIGDYAGPLFLELTEIKLSGYSNYYEGINDQVEVIGDISLVSANSAVNDILIGENTSLIFTIYNPSQFEIDGIVINDVSYDNTQFNINTEKNEITIDLGGCGSVCNMTYTLNEIHYITNSDVEEVQLYTTYNSVTVHYSNVGPVVITTAQEFLNICLDPDGSYVLGDDLDLSGGSYSLICNFSGYFNGDGYSIIGSNITSGGDTIGLFSTVAANGYLYDINLVDINITITSDDPSYIGGLAGRFDGYLERASISGVIDINNLTNFLFNPSVGGVFGLSYQGTFKDVSSYVEINLDGTSNQTLNVGGIGGTATTIKAIGLTSNSIINDDNSGITRMGNIVGRSSGSTYYKTYSNGTINITLTTGVIYAGGLIGYSSADTVIDFISIGEINSDNSYETIYIGGVFGNFIGGTLNKGFVNIYLEHNLQTMQHVYIGGVLAIGDSYYVDNIAIFNDVWLHTYDSSFTLQTSFIDIGDFSGETPEAGYDNLYIHSDDGFVNTEIDLDRINEYSVSQAISFEYYHMNPVFFESDLSFDSEVWDLSLVDTEVYPIFN